MTTDHVKQARIAYNLPHWGDGYFDINDEGHVVVYPQAESAALHTEQQAKGIVLADLVPQLMRMGLDLPVLLRFTDILQQRILALHHCFQRAKQQFNYQAQYTSVYPVKVNQQRRVVQGIVDQNTAEHPVGLEVGSKPELMIALALAQGDDFTIVCNGYKDKEYLRLALIGQKLGLNVLIIVEKLSELAMVLQQARQLQVQPQLGVRVRLQSIAKGKWQNTGGKRSKFGLTAEQVLTVVEQLRQAGQLPCLQVLHVHMGSQIANIRDIQLGLREAARYYVELCRNGAALRCVDVGGGLGVDYEGARSRSDCSMNYSVQEYANNVVQAFAEMCQQYQLEQPEIITECGRAMVAHHAVLLLKVLDKEQVTATNAVTFMQDGTSSHASKKDHNNASHSKAQATEHKGGFSIGEGAERGEHVTKQSATLQQTDQAAANASATSGTPLALQDLHRCGQTLGAGSLIESFHDARHYFSEVHTLYVHGQIDLQQRAQAELLYKSICHQIYNLLQPQRRAHRELLDELNELLADKLIGNFSIFQSLPDVWAIQQIFPVLPIHHLTQPLDKRAILHDITCDSDGQISRYIDREAIEPTFPWVSSAQYLGVFLVGAYQEILGDMHNLFGDTNSVHVELTPQGGYKLTAPLSGDGVDDVLRTVHFDATQMLVEMREKVHASNVGEDEKEAVLSELAHALTGYTYLEE